MKLIKLQQVGEKCDLENCSNSTVKGYDLTTSAVPFATWPVWKYWIR